MRRHIGSRGEERGKSMRLSPAFNDDFLLCEEIYSIPTLTVEVAEKTIFPAAEGEERHRGSDADVNADVSDLCFITELPGRRAATRKETRHIAVAAAVDEFNCIVNGFNVDQP